MAFVANNQLLLLLVCFVAGSVLAVSLFRKPIGHRRWRVADLIWVLVGGLGALIAVVAGLYLEDSSRLDRQIDLAFAASSTFDADAARFRLRYCEMAPQADTKALCDKVEFLSASTAKNAELPLFLSVSQDVAPLQGLQLFQLRPQKMQEMADMVQAFDPTPFLVFTTFDADTDTAVQRLQQDAPVIAADFIVLARSYDALIMRVASLKAEWEYLQKNAVILTLQVIALCLLSFAAPFRLGRSLADLHWVFFRKSPE